jgi:hypothetical protein
MSAANFAVIAASLLATASVFSDVPEDSGVSLLSSRDAVAQDTWPVASGVVSMPHGKKPVELLNAFRGTAPSSAPLSLCVTSHSLNVDVLEDWHSLLNISMPYQLYLVVSADDRRAKDKQLAVRRIVSLLRTNLAVYVEVKLGSDQLPRFMSAEDEIMLIQRDVCMRFMERRKPPADAFGIAVDITHASKSVPLHVHQRDGKWVIRTGEGLFSVVRNDLSGQSAHFAVPNELELHQGSTGAQVVFDATDSWQLERLRVGPRVVAGFLHGMAGHLMWLWSRSKGDLFQMTQTSNKTYALAARALFNKGKFEDDLHVVIRTLRFAVDERGPQVPYPLALGRCASYELVVLEPAISVIVDEGGQRQKRKGVLGRLAIKLQSSFETCIAVAASGMPIQMCQPQVTPAYRMRNAYGEEPKAALYGNVVPLLAKRGHCIAGGRVPLRHRRTYGSYSDYGIYPRGFDGYDMFSLVDGTVEGDSQAQKLLAPSVHNPKDIPDEDKVRIMPTLVPVRLKKAK